MTLRLWPRSLIGQMLLAVALALLLAQTIGAVLAYRAGAERREAALLHSAAYRFLSETRDQDEIAEGDRRRRGGFRIERTTSSPLRAGELRETEAESELRRILVEQDFTPGDIVVLRREVGSDEPARRRLARDMRTMHNPHQPRQTHILVAGVQLPDSKEWLVARVFVPMGERQIVMALLAQTLLTYLVLVGAIAFILRRITRPLAALTTRLERFAETRSIDGQLAPEGPDDMRRLIVAHNAMEDRISGLLDEKDVMLGAIGHDLKTPLAALRVRIESVENETERERMAATIEDIVRSLDDILSLARVGRPSDPLERTELSALVSSIVEEFEDMDEAVELGNTERIALPLRSTWLRRALRNLIGNALRYGQKARVSVARDGPSAVVRIEDDGPGIPDADIERMVEPFTRGEPSRNTETGGAGLGLTLARAIADQHGGSLELANRRGSDGRIEGLTATLRLPV
jgi:signal transduction histidine kinase